MCEYICMYNWIFAIYLKLTHYTKSDIFQFLKRWILQVKYLVNETRRRRVYCVIYLPLELYMSDIKFQRQVNFIYNVYIKRMFGEGKGRVMTRKETGEEFQGQRDGVILFLDHVLIAWLCSVWKYIELHTWPTPFSACSLFLN